MKAPHRTTISFPRGGIPNARGLYLLYAATSVLVPTHALPQTISDQAKASSCHLAIILAKREDNLKATGNESLLRAQHDVRDGSDSDVAMDYRRRPLLLRQRKGRVTASSRALVLSQPLDFFRPVDCHAKVGHQTVGERINPTVDTDCLSARPCALHNDIRRDVSHLPDDVKLAQTVEASTWLLDRIKLLTVLMEDLADRM